MILFNGEPGGHLTANDRGLGFGDGVFRTLECVDGVPRLWPWQYARLQADSQALGLDCPAASLLCEELARASCGLARAVCKIILTRGCGARGYAPAGLFDQTRIVMANPWGGYPVQLAEQGIRMRVCDLRLARQPRLAGIKHLNRLENVLARGEWDDPDIREGLLLDSQGEVIEGTMSNLFLLSGDGWQTPVLDQCGVAGAVRSWVMDQLPVDEVRVSLAQVLAADVVFVCNSLAGLWPVAAIGEHRWDRFDPVYPLQARLQHAA
jgi:4-amino-4-deoxychorismate lyase